MVSPQELVQTISIQSKRRFAIGIRCEVLELFSWLLMTLQKELNKHISKRSMHTNVLYEPFQVNEVFFECLYPVFTPFFAFFRIVGNRESHFIYKETCE